MDAHRFTFKFWIMETTSQRKLWEHDETQPLDLPGNIRRKFAKEITNREAPTQLAPVVVFDDVSLRQLLLLYGLIPFPALLLTNSSNRRNNDERRTARSLAWKLHSVHRHPWIRKSLHEDVRNHPTSEFLSPRDSDNYAYLHERYSVFAISWL